MSPRKKRFQVVVVGLGPVGAVAAHLAAAAGFDVLVVERALKPFALPRAIVFDAEIMRIFASIGLAEEIAKITGPLGGSVYIGVDGRPIRTFRSPGPPHAGAWEPSNLFYQPQLEATLREGLKRRSNVQVLEGCELVDIVADSQSAVVRLRENGTHEFDIEARFVLGCDGASSAIRKLLGIGLDDIGFEERWLVIDAHMHGPMQWPETYEIPPEVREGKFSLMVCDPVQPATIIPGVGNHRRWEYRLKAGETDAEAVDPDRLRQRLSSWADPDHVEIVRSAVYRFRALIAHHWREASVFLLGDAAHQTPPFYGQGMCHGIRDAAQLMWKLRLVADGAAPLALLDSYQLEREPQVRAVISASVRAGAAVCIVDLKLALERDLEFRAAEAARGTKTVAMTDVVPPLRAGLIDPATGGRRLPEFPINMDGKMQPLDECLAGRFTIVSEGGIALSPLLAARWRAAGGHSIELSAAHDDEGRFARWLAGFSAAAAVVRPDRYIYGMAKDPADLQELIERLFLQIDAQSGVTPDREILQT